MELIIPLTPQVLDTNTYTRRIDTDIACPINFADCPCEEPFCAKYQIPFTSTDVFQFYVSQKPTAVFAQAFNEDLPISPSPVSVQGTKITVDFALLPDEVDCFYIKYESAVGVFCMEFSLVRVFPQPERCEPSPLCYQPTLLIESDYRGKDCLGNRYTNGYKNTIRVFGSMEYIGTVQNAEETDKKRIIKQTIQQKVKIRTYPLPPDSWIVYHLSNVSFFGQNLQVNGQPFLFSGAIEKRNADHAVWSLDLDLLTPPCIKTNACE